MAKPSSACSRRRSPTAAEAMLERGHGGLSDSIAGLVKDINEQGGTLLAYRTHRSDHSPKGFPDWFLAGPGGAAAVELKRQRTKPTSEQKDWLAMLNLNGIPAVVLRPSDLLSGQIGAYLAALAALPVHVPPHAVHRLTRLLRVASGDTLAPDLAEILARAVLRAGYNPPTLENT